MFWNNKSPSFILKIVHLPPPSGNFVEKAEILEVLAWLNPVF